MWFCVHSRTLGVSPTNSPVRLGVSPTADSTPTGVFNRWFEALFLHAGTLGCVVCHWVCRLLPCPSGSTICHLTGLPASVLAAPGPQATALPPVLSTWLPVSTSPIHLDECVFSNSLVVGLPYSSIFCQFWLFFVFKLLSFFWLCEEAQCVYLCLHLGRKSTLLAFLSVLQPTT